MAINKYNPCHPEIPVKLPNMVIKSAFSKSGHLYLAARI